MVEKRWVYAVFFLCQIKNTKRMEQLKTEIKNKKQLELTKINETPFQYATDGERNYITCGRVILETDLTMEQVKANLENIPWEAIGMFIQAITSEMINESK